MQSTSTVVVGNMINEATLQRSFVGMFRVFYPSSQLILSLSGTALFGTPKQKQLTINDWKSQGWERGLPDLTICLPGSVTVHFELKRPGKLNDQSEEQVDMQAKLTKLGHHYYVLDDCTNMFRIIADHTELNYRQECFQQLTDSLPDQLTELFLYFPVGTPKQLVLEAVEPYYFL